MAEIKVTSLVRLFLMLSLDEGPKHGYELIKLVEEKLGKKPSTGQIYPFLRELQKKVYVKPGETGERDRHVYSLTPDGREFVKRLFTRFGALIDVAIKPSLVACAHCGCKIYKGGYSEKIKGKTLTFCCSHCAQSFRSSVQK